MRRRPATTARPVDAARLRSRPRAPAGGGQPVGLIPLGLDPERDALLYVPAVYRPDTPLPLALMLHGAGGTASGGLAPFLGHADAAKLVLLAPQSRGRTWDAVSGSYGPDVAFVDEALDRTMGRYAIDPGLVAVVGFSDGATYALGLGLSNGDLFGHVIAFSPGGNRATRAIGRPRVFVSHGVSDEVLSVDRSRRLIVPDLREEGYDVRYEQFEGGHDIPPAISSAALTWLLSGR